MPLQPGIDGGINDQAVGVEIKSVLFCPVTDLLPYIFPEIATFSPRSGRGVIVECHLFCLCDCILFICNKSVLGHQAENGIPAIFSPLWKDSGVVVVDGPKLSDERGRLQKIQVCCRFAKMGTCSRFDTKGAVAELHRIQVHLQDFLFGVVVLNLHRGDHFTKLSGNRNIKSDLSIEIPGELLADRRTTLKSLLKPVVGEAHETLRIYSPVVEKPMVFGCDQGVKNIGGDLVYRNMCSVFDKVTVRYSPVTAPHLRSDRCAWVLKLLNRGEALEQIDDKTHDSNKEGNSRTEGNLLIFRRNQGPFFLCIGNLLPILGIAKITIHIDVIILSHEALSGLPHSVGAG